MDAATFDRTQTSICIEKPNRVVFALEMSKPVALLVIAKNIAVALLARLTVFDIAYSFAIVYLTIFFLILTYSALVRYQVSDDFFRIYVEFRILWRIVRQNLALKNKREVSIIAITTLWAGLSNAVLFSGSAMGSDLMVENYCITQRGGSWRILIGIPIRFGFYGLKRDSCIRQYMVSNCMQRQ